MDNEGDILMDDIFTVACAICVGFIVLAGIKYVVQEATPDLIPIERRYVVTDKYTYMDGGLLVGSETQFVLNLSNIKTVKVCYEDYHKYEIGDYYYEVIGYYYLDENGKAHEWS